MYELIWIAGNEIMCEVFPDEEATRKLESLERDGIEVCCSLIREE